MMLLVSSFLVNVEELLGYKSNFCTINNRLELAFEEIFKVFDLKAK